MRKKIDERTRAIVVINPNNPTGAIYSKKFLQGVVDVAAEHDVPIISDEIYDLITFSDYTPMSSLAKDVKLVALNGISKNYVSPGWRIGYSSFYNCDELYEACLRLARIRLCANTPASYGLLSAYTGDDSHIEPMKKKLLARRDLLMKRFDEMGIPCVTPKGAFYAFPRCPGDDREFVKGLLESERVLTVFGSGFGEMGKNHFRVVFLPDEATLSEACDRIERYVRRL
jgi:aspartate/methionine/tyrosine aminotransferase